MNFEELFPSLKDCIHKNQHGHKAVLIGLVKDGCVDKQRLREAMEKLWSEQSYLKDVVDGISPVEQLMKELGL